MDTSAFWQDTKDPICAINTATPTDRRKVLLPPMFGPVMMWKRPDSVGEGWIECGLNLAIYLVALCFYAEK